MMPGEPTLMPCECGWQGGTYGTDDPAIRRCDMCGGTVATNPATGDYVCSGDPEPAAAAEIISAYPSGQLRSRPAFASVIVGPHFPARTQAVLLNHDVFVATRLQRASRS